MITRVDSERSYINLMGRAQLQGTLAATAVLGLSINHSTFVCTRYNEPLMTSVAGNLKNVLGTVIGALIFPDFRFHPLNVLGLALGMAGAVWYATESAMKVRSTRIVVKLLRRAHPLSLAGFTLQTQRWYG
jgi:drug/metabolite transporter (DMT)-like permease